WAALVNLAVENYEQALDDFDEHELKQGRRPPLWREEYKTLRQALQANRPRARGYWLKCLESISDSKDLMPYWYAECDARLGDKAQALAGLEEALKQRDTVEDLLVDEFWDGYRDDPEFKDILKKVGLDRWAR